MSNVDWSKAPEGATHWMPETEHWRNGFWKRDGDVNYYFTGVAWRRSTNNPFDEQNIVKRPAAPQWSGEGLPPVWTVCMVYPHNTLWGFRSTSGHRRKILAYHGDFVWLGNDCMALESTRIDKVDFKPLRTPEQIAAEEREKAIKAMVDVLQVSDNLSGTAEYIVCGILHDAGYRKLEQPE